MQHCCKMMYICVMFRYFLVAIFFLSLLQTASAQYILRVFGEDAEPLIGGSLLHQNTRKVYDLGLEGRASVAILESGLHRFVIQQLGYDDLAIERSLEAGVRRIDTVYLRPRTVFLEMVNIIDEHAKLESSLAHEHLSQRYFERNNQGNFSASLERIPGISAIKVGVGIAKPVIRGLSSNRVVVNHYGIKQEGQQWGSDHGLEIDAFDVERVEIVKGPGALQYGSNAMGGVINLQPGKILPNGQWRGSVQTIFKTNNAHYGTSAFVATTQADYFFSGRFTYQSFGDYRVPADRFLYNSFSLPILNGTLKNTAGRERNLAFTVGKQSKTNITRLVFNHYKLEAGLFSGAVGIPRSYSLVDDGNSRDIDSPSQEVDHYRVTLNQSYAFDEDHLNLNVGYQRNLRKEFSFPEFHSVPRSQLEANDRLAVSLDLQTISGNAHYDRHMGWGKAVYGVDAQYQHHQTSGFQYLLPRFDLFRIGSYALFEKNDQPDLVLNGGLRMDFGNNNTQRAVQGIFNSNEQLIDSLVSPAINRNFWNFSASIGLNKSLSEHSQFKLNFGKSFRLPYPSETSINGIHHGTFRHEVGNPDLRSEHGYQLDVAYSYDQGPWRWDLSVFTNYFRNYIYLGPSFPATFSRLPEAGQLFVYRQDDALFGGFEFYSAYDLSAHWGLELTGEFVQSYNIQSGFALPFTPQPSLKPSLEFRQDGAFLRWFSDGRIAWRYDHYFGAEGRYRIDRSERATPGYGIWSLTAELRLGTGKNAPYLNFEIQNITNTAYLNHLSRYRLINVVEQGRNFVVSCKVPFGSRGN